MTITDATTTDDTTTTVVLPARHLAYAWTAIARAVNPEYDRPVLAAVSIEVFGPDTVRLTATDSYSIYTCCVGPASDVDDLDSTPDSTWLIDPVRAVSVPFMDEARENHTATTTLVLNEAGAVITATTVAGPVTITLPACPGSFPDWRTLVRKAQQNVKAGSTGHTHLGPKTLKVLADLATRDRPVELQVAGPLDALLVRIGGDGSPPILGAVMPVRKG